MDRINPQCLMQTHRLVNFDSKCSKYISLSIKSDNFCKCDG